MKRFLAISAILASAIGLFSCEKHSWEKETSKLYHAHGDHADHSEDSHDKAEEKK